MKKVVFLIICCLLLNVSLVFAPMADESDSLDNRLIIHYDFEGSTLEEQLSDKATAGKSNDALNTYNEDDLSVSNGVAHIKGTDGLLIKFAEEPEADPDATDVDPLDPETDDESTDAEPFDPETAAGADFINNATGEYTFYFSMAVIGDGLTKGGFRDFFTIYGETAATRYLRIYGGNCNLTNQTKDYTFTTGSLAATKLATFQYSEIGSNEEQFSNFAITMKYNATTEKWDYNGYLSIDGGVTYYLVLEASAANPANYLSDAKMFGFGNRNVNGKTEYKIDDFRLYDKALSAAELASLNATNQTPDPADESAETSTNTQPATNQPTTTENKPAATEPLTTESAESDATDKKKGCSSSIAFGAIPCALLAVGACLLTKKKKETY